MGLKFLESTTIRYNSSNEVPSTIARREALKYFPQLSNSDVELTLITSNQENVIVTDGVLADKIEAVFRDYSVGGPEC